MSKVRSADIDDLVRRERRWHEENDHKRSWLSALLYDPPAFDRVVAEGCGFLNLEPDGMVLDMACGEGKETLALAVRGAQVVATDLTLGHLLQARQKVATHEPQAQVLFVQADAHRLPFAGGAFPAVYGKAILHHLVLSQAVAEVDRLLTPGGRAAFAEPMNGHPLFRFGRRLTPQLRTADEHPLGWAEMDGFGRGFATYRLRGHMLISPAAYLFRLLPGGEGVFRRVHAGLQRLDEWLLGRAPKLRRWAWYGSVYVVKGVGQQTAGLTSKNTPGSG